MFLHPERTTVRSKARQTKSINCEVSSRIDRWPCGEMSVAMQYYSSRLELPWKEKYKRYVDGHNDKKKLDTLKCLLQWFCSFIEGAPVEDQKAAMKKT